MQDNHRHLSGVILVVVSALVFSTAGVFTKGVTTAAWGVIFWRGLAAAGFTFGYMIYRGHLRREIALFGGPAVLVVVLSALGTAAFIPAFKLTSIANVALIYASAPLFTAALAWLFIRERASRLVLVASLFAFVGVMVIVSGSLGSGRLIGDMLALWMTLMLAGIMVVYRRWPDTTAALPAAVSSLFLLPVAMLFGDPFAAPAHEMQVLILFGLVFAVASVTLAEGARRLPSAETALLSSLEVPFAPLWAFLILSQLPGMPTIIGGTIVLIAVLGSQLLQLKPR